MNRLIFNLQNASASSDLPTKQQFKKWAKAALRIDTGVTIRIVDTDEGRALNLAYRKKDYATNVQRSFCPFFKQVFCWNICQLAGDLQRKF